MKEVYFEINAQGMALNLFLLQNFISETFARQRDPEEKPRLILSPAQDAQIRMQLLTLTLDQLAPKSGVGEVNPMARVIGLVCLETEKTEVTIETKKWTAKIINLDPVELPITVHR